MSSTKLVKMGSVFWTLELVTDIQTRIFEKKNHCFGISHQEIFPAEKCKAIFLRLLNILRTEALMWGSKTIPLLTNCRYTWFVTQRRYAVMELVVNRTIAGL